MTDVAFYHLQASSLEQVLPKLLEKMLADGHRVVVLSSSAERVEALATLLWTYHQDAWLPHGTIQDGFAADQPVWLSERDENPNGARFLVLTDGAESERLGDYARCFDLFDGQDAAAAERARGRWQACRAAGHVVSYWQQTDKGGWEKKA